MATIHELALQRPLPARAVVMGEVAGRSGLLAVQADSAVAAARAPDSESAAAAASAQDPTSATTRT
jgi:hypothetical protein